MKVSIPWGIAGAILGPGTVYYFNRNLISFVGGVAIGIFILFVIKIWSERHV